MTSEDGAVTLVPTMSPSGTFAPTVSRGGAARKFSYFCLESEPDMCLGVSPGADVPAEGLLLQLKPYSRNNYKGIDHKKMRWDVVESNFSSTDATLSMGYLRLEAEFPILCADRRIPEETNVKLYKCYEPNVSMWKLNQGALQLKDDETLCATVAVCIPRQDAAQSCRDGFSTPVTDGDFKLGAIVHLKPCYFSQAQFAKYRAAQSFTRDVDCVAGCSPEMQQNDLCDEVCNNPECKFDSNDCATRSPVQNQAPPLTDPPTFPPSLDAGLDGLTDLDAPNFWWIALLFLLLFILTTLALLKRRRRKFRKVVDGGDAMDRSSGVTSGLYDSRLAVPEDDEDLDDARFKTASAVALNQLRYHSRAASTSSSPSVNSKDVRRAKAESSNNDKRYQFEEVGLV